MEFQEFPKMLYFKGDPTNQKTVNSAAEEEAWGEDWIDTPIDPASAAAAAAMVPAATMSIKKK
jgi:hypothetical protein